MVQSILHDTWPTEHATRWISRLTGRDNRLNIRHAAYHHIAPGWFVGPMSVPEHIVWFVTEGGCKGSVGTDACTLESGTLLIMPPGTRFEMRLADKKVSTQNHRFRLSLTQKGRALSIAPNPLKISRAWTLRPLVDQVIDESQLERPYSDVRIRATLAILFTELARLIGETSTPTLRLTHAQCQQIVRLATDRVADHLTPADLAHAVNLSPDYFTRLFSATFGFPPRRWLLEHRIREAAFRLSESSLGISEVAYSLGYSDVFLFSRQFKQIIGCSPRAYRKSSIQA